MDIRGTYKRFDRYQQQHRFLGFPLAVRQKYSEDQGGYLAATITYYGFFSLFPLLLVFTAILGFVLNGNPSLQHRIVNSVLGQFPVIGHDLATGKLNGNGLLLGLSAAAALWAGMGVMLAAENAMNHVWGIPYTRRPDFLRARLHAFLLLLGLGAGALVTTGLGTLGTIGASFGIGWKLGAVVLATLINVGLFWLALGLLTSNSVGWRCHRGGAIFAGIAYECLQLGGGLYINHVLKSANNTYGTFGVVIGLLTWIYLGAHITLLGAEGNVVATRKLSPRSLSLLFEEPPTDADKRALGQRAKIEQRRQDETVEVGFGER